MGSAQHWHPCTGWVISGKGQVRSHDGGSCDWGKETQADHLYHSVLAGQL